MTAIDLSRVRGKINRHFPDHHTTFDARVWCLRKLWENPDTNDVGVFNEREEIRFELKGQRNWSAEIQLAAAPNGWHTFATGYNYSTGGGGYAPSVSARVAYPSRQEAYEAGLAELIDRFKKLSQAERPDTEGQKHLAERMVEVLEDALYPKPLRPEVAESQLNLFEVAP